MKVTRTGIQQHKIKSFKVKRSFSEQQNYTFQLFWTPIHFMINGKAVITPPNTIILFDKDAPQEFSAADDLMINDFVLFKADEQDVEELIFNKPITVPNPELFHSYLRFIYDEFYSANPQSEETTDYLLRALLSKCRELYSNYDLNESFPYILDEFADLRYEISVFPNWDWKISNMAKQCKLSPSRFQYTYKKLFSVPPMTDVLHFRIVKAKTMLKSSDLSIKEIAQVCGYKNDVHFMRQFKKATGITATQYRKNHENH